MVVTLEILLVYRPKQLETDNKRDVGNKRNVLKENMGVFFECHSDRKAVPGFYETELTQNPKN